MCNRLDFATSGLMLVALNQQAAKHASALFRKREVGPNGWLILYPSTNLWRERPVLQSQVGMCGRCVLHLPAVLLSTNPTPLTLIDAFQSRLQYKGFSILIHNHTLSYTIIHYL